MHLYMPINISNHNVNNISMISSIIRKSEKDGENNGQQFGIDTS